METSSLLGTEFTTLVIRMPKDLSENLNNVKKGPVRNDRYTK